jgi:glutathione peroxidase
MSDLSQMSSKTLPSIAKLSLVATSLVALTIGMTFFSANASAASCPDYLNVEARKLHSDDNVNLCELTQGKTVLIVNTASNCGFTSQFEGLEALHKQYKDKGLVVIGFPSDDFFQEEKDEAKTADVSTSPVRGNDANSVFQHLNEKSTAPKWNFYKYLVSGDGETVTEFSSRVKPDSEELKKAIDKQLSI